MNSSNRIENFPISFFSVIMGLLGYTIALQKFEKIFKISFKISNVFLYIGIISFLIIALFYIIKILFSFEHVKKEFNNPIKLNFFPTFSISLLLMSIAFLNINIQISKYLFIFGTIIHFILTLIIITQWISQSHYTIQHYNPSWFIPVVGNIIIPIAGVEHANKDISIFFFSIGIIFWIALFSIFLYRIIFHNPIPEKLIPTLFIIIAPPSIAFISYAKITNNIDLFAKSLYFIAIFLTILIFIQYKLFLNIKFYLSWWAYSFPLAAISIASSIMLVKSNIVFYRYIFLILISVLSIFIFILFINTFINILKKNICVEEP